MPESGPAPAGAGGSDGDAAARAFVTRLGRALHAYGYPAHRLEEALTLIAARLGQQAQFFSTPTSLMLSFGEDGAHTSIHRVQPGQLDLAKLARVDEVVSAVAAGGLPPAEGARRLEAIAGEPPPWGRGLATLAFALSSAAAARFFGGGAGDVAASGVIGLGTGALSLLAGRFAPIARVFEPLAAAQAALLAVLLPGLLASSIGPFSTYLVTLAGLIVLIPGFSLTVAMTELATRNLVSGTARLFGAVGTFLTMGFGVALGTRLGEALGGATGNPLPAPLPYWTLWLALLVAPLGFTVLLQAEARDAPFVVAAGAIAFFGAREGTQLLGPEVGVFFGALAVASAGNAYSWWQRRPSVIPLVPGLLLLVPGSIGFQSLSSMLARETLVGVEAAFRMTLVAVSLAAGLLFAAVVLPPRPLLPRRSD